MSPPPPPLRGRSYCFKLESTGDWSLTAGPKHGPLQTGKLAGFDPSQWHKLELSIKGFSVTGIVDGTQVSEAGGARRVGGRVGAPVLCQHVTQRRAPPHHQHYCSTRTGWLRHR